MKDPISKPKPATALDLFLYHFLIKHHRENSNYKIMWTSFYFELRLLSAKMRSVSI